LTAQPTPVARWKRARLAAGAAQHEAARPESGGEHDDGGDPEGRNGERAMRAGEHKQREQASGERRAHVAEPRCLPRNRNLAVMEDDFLSFAHRRSPY
jgi:hypothetical protein